MVGIHDEMHSEWFPAPVPVPVVTGYGELGVRPDATPDEVRVATARRARVLTAERELAGLNSRSLTGSDRRAEHDDEHPPCSVLRLEPVWSLIFDDPAVALERLRADLESFLCGAEGGDAIPFPVPTDLERSDFSGDFRHHPLLDGVDHS
ncbi:hypothetical protein [Winogradskya humida]|uniref:Uncharacterized protein n=1 Tax=Winogradskya humida TaxID=113566 RepID=A0ABQ4A2S3_9ACTN|nr:hypothetical protein [Actinoplanes humidus]GIE24652.1 hypothetical protein Ahu01nite_077540 [Actinoplanes humidus]